MHKHAVLHVEDQDEAAYLFEQAMLEVALSVDLFRVSDGEEALSFLYRHGAYQQAMRPDVVILDINMPKVDGWAVLTAMQRDEILRAIPVVVLSTSSRPADEAKALSLGARKYITKPVLFEDWVEQVQSALATFLAADTKSASIA